jgi:hypothetical protein
MSENFEQQKDAHQQPEIIRNDVTAKDSTVVVDEPGRTVVLTDDETIVIEKEQRIPIAPRNRPRKVNLGMFGRTEYLVVGLGLLSVAATVLFYVFVVMPARAQLASRKADRDRVEKELTSMRDKFQGFTTTKDQVARLVSSAEDFENRNLYVAGSGHSALYQRLNTLIAGYGLVNTAGPDYAPLEINQRQEGQGESDRGRAKYQSLFPGVYVTMTVEGSYQNLRRFLRDIETSQQFMVISAVSLEPSETTQQQQSSDGTNNVQSQQQQQQQMMNNQPVVTSPNQPYARPNMPGQMMPNNQGFGNPTGQMPNMGQQQPQQPQSRPAPRGRTIGEVVSLRVEIAAYFKRNLAAMTPLQQQ